MVDTAVISTKILKYWQRIKVYRMPLDKYLENGKIEIFKREIESLIEV